MLCYNYVVSMGLNPGSKKKERKKSMIEPVIFLFYSIYLTCLVHRVVNVLIVKESLIQMKYVKLVMDFYVYFWLYGCRNESIATMLFVRNADANFLIGKKRWKVILINLIVLIDGLQSRSTMMITA